MIITEKEAEAFLETHGFPVSRRFFCSTLNACEKAARRLRYPVAMKVSSSMILHKSDVGGVVLDITGPTGLKRAFQKIRNIKGFEGVMVQEYLMGESLLLGLKKDATFGHAVAVGSGGIYTEVLKDVSFRVCPLTARDAEEMMEELKIYPVIKGMRGGRDWRKNVRDIVLKVSKLAETYPMIHELDINPLMLSEKGAIVVDARMVVESTL